MEHDLKGPIAVKTERIIQGRRPRVLDLFAGCGGISLGFHSAGFEIVGALEIDKAAARSHALNFHPDSGEDRFEIHAKARDIVSTEPAALMREFGFDGPADAQVDVIVGGPPCQAFARVGRAKLREVAEHPEAFLKDPRSNLYLRYLDYVKALKPLAILIENVPDLLNYGGHNIAEEICEVLDDLGYEPRYTLLNAVYFGVPEMRERMFLVAYHRDIAFQEWFPEPTHWVDLPKGYHGTRQVAMKTIQPDLFNDHKYFVFPKEPESEGREPAVTAYEALSDLPVIGDDSEQKNKKGPRRFDRTVSYPKNARLTPYQKIMRKWPGFEAPEGISDHVIRFLPRDYKIFARMNPGDQYPEAHNLAVRMFEEHLAELKITGRKVPKEASEAYEKLKAVYVPPYDPGKFPNKWRKMESDKPARTLMAHLGKDSYSHIHYASSQARTISVREAARLQSFPDGFVFEGPMNPAFRQIGNAVPPLMAKAIAVVMMNQISQGVKSHEEAACA